MKYQRLRNPIVPHNNTDSTKRWKYSKRRSELTTYKKEEKSNQRSTLQLQTIPTEKEIGTRDRKHTQKKLLRKKIPNLTLSKILLLEESTPKIPSTDRSLNFWIPSRNGSSLELERSTRIATHPTGCLVARLMSKSSELWDHCNEISKVWGNEELWKNP